MNKHTQNYSIFLKFIFIYSSRHQCQHRFEELSCVTSFRQQDKIDPIKRHLEWNKKEGMYHSYIIMNILYMHNFITGLDCIEIRGYVLETMGLLQTGGPLNIHGMENSPSHPNHIAVFCGHWYASFIYRIHVYYTYNFITGLDCIWKCVLSQGRY